MKQTLRERLASLSRGEVVALVLVLAVTLAGAGLWYMRSLPKPVAIAASGSAFGDAPTAIGGSAAPIVGPPPSQRFISPSPAAALIVDVAGGVRKPGVYEFAEGDRVVDAIQEAGGAKPRAPLTGLNLAAPLTDGQQILVPEPLSRREAAAAAEASAGSASDGTTTTQVNINTADATELETLSGIGEVLAQRIVDYRDENGPFATVQDLLDVSGIGDATLAEFQDDITV